MDKNGRPIFFKSMVTIGDSITAGMSASPIELCWVNRLASELSACQRKEIQLKNAGISSNLLSPRSPAYEHSSKPCGIERFENDVINHEPDLVIIAYGLNDVRGGTPVDIFIEDLDFMVKSIQKSTNSVLVLANVYFMTNFSFSTGIWDKGNLDIIRSFNQRIFEVSNKNHVLFADIFSAMNETEWTVSQDGIHPNNLGHRLISNRIFEEIATHCSCMSNF